MGSVVRADDGEDSIVTELHPGWNLIGWVQDAAPTSELFDAIPVLDRVAAYDSASASWVVSVRAGQSGNVQTLRPGRAYWLHVNAEQSVEWIRTRGSYNNQTELQGGNNFVAWRALDRVPAAVGLRQIRDSAVVVGSWDAARQRWRLAIVSQPLTRWAISEFNHGEGLWINVSADVTWNQLTGESPRVSFVGPVSEQQRAETLADLETYRETFAATFGGVVSGAHVVVFSDTKAASAWRQEVRGSGSAPCGGAVAWEASYTISCGKSVLAHEYFHLLQYAASAAGVRVRPPNWMTEGGATYAQLLAVSVEGFDFSEAMRSTWRSSRADGRGLTTVTDAYDHHQYLTGAAAVHLLLQTNSAEELLLYERRLSSGDTYSRAVFAEQFGISIPDLDALMDTATPHFDPPGRATALQTQEPPLRLQVEIQAPEGSRYHGTATIGFFAADRGRHFSELAIEGSLSVPVVSGRYEVQTVDVGGGCQVGFDAPGIVVEDRLVDTIASIRLEATGCDAVLSGTVLGRDGLPLHPGARRVWVELFPESAGDSHWSRATQVAPDASGRFQATVAPDRYSVAVSPIESGNAVFGWMTDDGISLDRDRRMIVDLTTDLTQEVTIRLPISRTIRISGVVYDDTGRPIENLLVVPEGSGGGYLRPRVEDSRGYIGWGGRTDSSGSFGLLFAGQDAVIVLFDDKNCHLGWFGPDGFTTDLSEVSYWETQDRDISDLRIELPRSACE